MAELFVILGCVALNGFLASFEMAFVTIPRQQLKHSAKNGSRAAAWALARRAAPERTLSVIQIGITLVGAVAAAVGGVGAAENVEPYFIRRWGMTEGVAEVLAVLLVVLPITYLTVVLGELTPKVLALRAPLFILRLGARWVGLADRVLGPVVSLLEFSTHWTLKLLFFWTPKGTKPARDLSQEVDELDPTHREAVVNLVQLERRRIKGIYVPWSEVVSVDTTQSAEDIAPLIFASGHTRLPVMRGSHVVGVLHTKEFLASRENGSRDWQSSVRKILTVRLSDALLPVLRRMQSEHTHMAVVVSGDARPLGIVTMEDILEEFLGDIYDEDEHSRIRSVFADRVKARGLSSRNLND